jgi:AraC family transcriptional regulator, regulatory protein of adaptative response / methylated-DNA-[protein]-cysteine methyltransferase
MNDYKRIETVIRYLDEHHRQQPDLATLADVAGLTPYHFHRLFRSWASVTPKDFLQCLTLEHVRSLLKHGDSVLGASIDAGLSSPGRLHDLCVSLEAATPGEMKAQGEGLDIVYGFAGSPFGDCLVGETSRGICHLSFVDGGGGDQAPVRLVAQWPKARLLHDDAAANETASRIFAPSLDGRAPLRAFVRGTAFQVRVWRALLEVEAGSLVTYKQLAMTVCGPKAARAVGAAAGANPLAYLIPCHRVIRETGILGGYRWGLERKRAMIAWESARSSVASGS